MSPDEKRSMAGDLIERAGIFDHSKGDREAARTLTARAAFLRHCADLGCTLDLADEHTHPGGVSQVDPPIAGWLHVFHDRMPEALRATVEAPWCTMLKNIETPEGLRSTRSEGWSLRDYPPVGAVIAVAPATPDDDGERDGEARLFQVVKVGPVNFPIGPRPCVWLALMGDAADVRESAALGERYAATTPGALRSDEMARLLAHEEG